MDTILTMLGLSPATATAAIGAFVAVCVFKGLEYGLKKAAAYALKTETKLDDELVEAIANAVHAKLK